MVVSAKSVLRVSLLAGALLPIRVRSGGRCGTGQERDRLDRRWLLERAIHAGPLVQG